MGLSGSDLMPCVPCVLPQPGTLCSMLAHVGVDVVCLCSWVLVGRYVSVPVVCNRTRAGAAVQFCAWSPWQGSRPMSWWGGSRALWARGVLWGGRIASRLCPNRVRVRYGVREKVLRCRIRELRANVSAWYKYFRVVFSHSLGNSPRVGALCVARFMRHARVSWTPSKGGRHGM